MIKTCPLCLKQYVTRHEDKAAAFVTTDMESREQWLSGCCSTKCWDKHVPVDEDDDGNPIYNEDAEDR